MRALVGRLNGCPTPTFRSLTHLSPLRLEFALPRPHSIKPDLPSRHSLGTLPRLRASSVAKNVGTDSNLFFFFYSGLFLLAWGDRSFRLVVVLSWTPREFPKFVSPVHAEKNDTDCRIGTIPPPPRPERLERTVPLTFRPLYLKVAVVTLITRW